MRGVPQIGTHAAGWLRAHSNSNTLNAVALVDASSYIFRYHHAFNSSRSSRERLTSERGQDTTIQHAFARFVLGLLEEDQKRPWGSVRSAVVVFDGGGSRGAITADDARGTSFRRQMHPEYKARLAAWA
jgi:5'-3' exonuclease